MQSSGLCGPQLKAEGIDKRQLLLHVATREEDPGRRPNQHL